MKIQIKSPAVGFVFFTPILHFLCNLWRLPRVQIPCGHTLLSFHRLNSHIFRQMYVSPTEGAFPYPFHSAFCGMNTTVLFSPSSAHFLDMLLLVCPSQKQPTLSSWLGSSQHLPSSLHEAGWAGHLWLWQEEPWWPGEWGEGRGQRGITDQRGQAQDGRRSECCASPTPHHWLEPVPSLWLPATAHLRNAGPALGQGPSWGKATHPADLL